MTTGVIPADWAVDAEGKPTTDPNQVYALQPMAGPKGSGLALLIDLMSGGLAGGVCGPRIHRMYDDFENTHDLAHTFVAIRADAFAEGRPADAVVTETVADFRTQPPALGFDEVLLPGEMEARKAAAASTNGLSLPPQLLESLRALGLQYGTEFPQ